MHGMSIKILNFCVTFMCIKNISYLCDKQQIHIEKCSVTHNQYTDNCTKITITPHGVALDFL